MERYGAVNIKYKEAARMAKERIPQLEQAIKQLTMHEVKPKRQKEIESQLNLFA
jgi:DNA-binding transcriptional regulator YdaS (Cro superfamily)